MLNSNNSDEWSIRDWEYFSLFDAFAKRPPIQYIVGNIFSLPSLNIVYGAPGSFKSFLLADLACCVAGGKDWLPNFGDANGGGITVNHSAVIWIDFDNGQRRTLERFKALGNAIQLPGDVPLHIYSMPTPVFNAANVDQYYELEEIIKGHNAKFVIFDNLAMISSRVDENSSEMAKIFMNLRRLSDLTDSAIVVIHHPSKGTYSQDRLGDSLRGHSSILAAIDLALYTKQDGKNLSVDIKPTKVRDSIVEPFTARFDSEIDQNCQLTRARFYSSTGSLDNKTVDVMGAISEALTDGKLNKGDLTSKTNELLKDTDAINVGLGKIGNIIEEMFSQGFIVRHKGKNNAQLFSLNPDKPFKRLSNEEGDSPQ